MKHIEVHVLQVYCYSREITEEMDTLHKNETGILVVESTAHRKYLF